MMERMSAVNINNNSGNVSGMGLLPGSAVTHRANGGNAGGGLEGINLGGEVLNE